MLSLSQKQSSDGIVYLSPVNDEFEKKYTALRKKEGYLLSIDEVRRLPLASANKEIWNLRKQTAVLFQQYVAKKTTPLSVLEIGCGNGWFSNSIAQNSNVAQVFGLDINQFELRLACETFASDPKLHWVYADIFTAEIEPKSFDMIVLNSSVQYFPDLSRLVLCLKQLLKHNGEIHILDSPFYKTPNEQKKAAERSAVYFSSMSFPEMAEHYTPHLLSELDQFKPVIMYRPSFIYTLAQKLKLPGLKVNPFFWFKITN